ncbi:hypothetical protein A2366_03530 [Candidatus Woesebacteria bacterium RIFOXYB1_FULL_33_9]|nr:MAG: hypothetical protein A2366_03530 [Candidatus Woesebacteria bacterium RIFOXYB1_FULL_33_9]
MQDDLQAFRVQQLDKCLEDFQIPCRWVPDAGYGYGYPQFNYYPPSVYYVGAIMHRLGLQYIDTVKILFVLGYVASALAMFVLIDSILGSWPAFVSSILYTYVPYKAVEVYVRGAMSEFWSLTFFPLILWAIYLLIKTDKYKYFIWFSVSLGLLLTTHNLMSLIFAPIAIFWTVFWLWKEKKKKWIEIFFSGLFGIGLAAFFTLPVIIETKFVHVESMLGGYFDYRAHFVSLYKLFISREWGYGSSGFPNELLNLSTGIVQWIVGLIAVALALINYKQSLAGFAGKANKKISVLTFLIFIFSLLTVFMIHMKSSFIWARLPVLWWLQFPWRFLSISIFLLSILGGFAIHFSKKYKYLLGGIIIISAFVLNISFFVPKDWLNITDKDKFGGISWQKQMTISIFDYLPIYATLPPINEAPSVPEIMDGKAEVSNYKKGSDFQTGNIKVLENATIRLPVFDFPGMKVTVNGKVISHYNNDCRGEEFCYGLISFKLPDGNHMVEVRLTNTPIRKIGNYITLTSIIILIWLSF